MQRGLLYLAAKMGCARPCQHTWGSLQQWCLLSQGTEAAVGHAMALRGHDIAKLRVQDLTTADGQSTAHSLHVLLVGQKFCF